MRSARFLGAITLLLALAGPASAQGVLGNASVALPETRVLYTATVRVPEAEVRSGPSTDPKLYPTNRLRQGNVVEVVKELEGGWLAIKPPPGSFSWVNARFLRQENRTTWVVVAHPDVQVPVLYGSSLKDDKPTVEGARLPRGTMVIGIDDKARPADDGLWLSIEPPEREVRYVRADAVVKKQAPAPAAPGAAPPVQGPLTSNPAPIPPAPAAAPETDPRWLQAQQAEQSGNRADAIRLYEQLGNETARTNHDLAMRAYSRAQFLRDVNQHSAQQPGRPTAANRPIPSSDSRLYPIPAALHAVAAPGPAPCTPCQTQTTSASPATVHRSGPGRLRRAAWCMDYQRTYALEDSQGRVRLYVTASPGIDLESHVNRNVEVFGPMAYRADWRVHHLRATQVMPLQ